MSAKYRKILISSAIVAIILVIAAAYMGWHYQSMAAYTAKIAQADQMMDDKDYKNAILTYQDAIGDKPKEEEGYLHLASAYQMTGHDDYAVETIELALKNIPESERLRTKMDELSGIKTTVAIVFDESILETLGSHSYYDYGNKNSIESTKAMSNGSICVRVKGLEADLIFSNTDDQPNAVSGNSIEPDSLPAAVKLDDIMTIFGGGDSASFEKLQELGLENLKKDSNQEYGSVVTFTKDLYSFVIQSDKDGNITNKSENIIYIPGPSERKGGTSVSGKVIDAVTGAGVGNVNISVTGKSGDTIEVVTDGSGNFEAKIESGDCKFKCSADGYIEETKNIYVPSYSSSWNCEIVISPDVASGEARIVLTWGSSPADLDSHLIGNGIHVSFMNPVAGSTADLDLDDIDGYGPETTTLHDLKGNYTFVVHKFSSGGSLANSGAEVTVYLPGQSPQTISISGSGNSDTWVVFELNDGKLNIINEIKDYSL